MRNPLLERSTPRELAERGQVIEKQEELQIFPQLTEVLSEDMSSLEPEQVPPKWRQAPVGIRLDFAWGGHRQQTPVLNGRVRATVPAVCQRCLEPLEIELDLELKLLLAPPGSDAVEAEGFDVWELEDTTVRPLDIVEESLTMALPLYSMHEPGSRCEVQPAVGEPGGSEDTIRPFADLRSRLRQKE